MNTWADGNSRSWEPVPDVIGDDHAFLQILRAAREVSVELRNSIIYNRSYSLARIRSLVEHVEQALVFARTSDAYSDVRRVDDLTRHLLKRLVDPGQFPAKGKRRLCLS